MKKILFTMLLAFVLSFMVGCGCKHNFAVTDCENAKTCTLCGKTEGKPIEHTFVAATCENAKSCSLCGKTEGEPLEHAFVDATCENAKSCSLCGKIEGEPLDHTFADATCESAKSCTLCGKTEGEPLEHIFMDATCETAKTCTLCGNTEGKPLGHAYINATCETAKTCTLCGNTQGEPLKHTFTDATCENAQTCSLCKATKGRPLGHTVAFGECSRCHNPQGKTLVNKILTLLNDANDIIDTAFYNQTDNLSVAENTVSGYYLALSTEIYLYEKAYAKYKEAHKLCGDYDELKSLKESIAQVMSSFPLHISNNYDSVTGYFDTLEQFVIDCATCELYMVTVSELIE